MATASKQFELKGLREKRSKIRTEIEAIGTAMRNESRAITPEEKGKFDKLNKEYGELGDQIRSGEADLAQIDSILNDDDIPSPTSRAKPGRDDRAGDADAQHATKPVDPEAYNRDANVAMNAWCRSQYNVELSRDEIEACNRVGFNPKTKELNFRLGDPKTRKQRLNPEKRALTITTSGGGYLIAQDYSNQLERVLVDFSGIRGVAGEFQTEGGNPLPWPTEDDTSNTGELLAINTQTASNADPSFASVTFGAYKFSSKCILVPYELIQDSAFDVASLIFSEAGTRIGRAQSTYFATGTGSSQPKGVVACASAGITTASATAFTATELMQLSLAVDRAYKSAPGVGYMMKEDVLGYAMLLKDADGNPLFRESWRTGMNQPMLNGYPVYVNQAFTGLTSNAPVTATKHVLFGDFTKFKIRDAGAVRMYRLVERYKDYDQDGFVCFLRSDSNCVNTAAIKYMLQA